MARDFLSSEGNFDFLNSPWPIPVGIDSPVTICCWYWQRVISGDNIGGLYRGPQSNNDRYTLVATNTGALDYTNRRNNGSQESISTVNTIGAKEWHHAAARTRSITDRDVILDADFANKGSGVVSVNPTGIDSFCVGTRNENTTTITLNGQVRDFCIWQDILTDQEIFLLRWGLAATEDIRPETQIAYVDYIAGHGKPRDRISGFLMSTGGAPVETGLSPAIHGPTLQPDLPGFIIGLINVEPDPVVINANLPAIAVNRVIAPTPAVINANLPAVQVQREIRPTPVVINANLPAITRIAHNILTPTAAVINANLPAAAVNRQIRPTPAVINANLPAVQVQREIAPTPVVINANLPTIQVQREVLPTPVVINANLPAIVIDIPLVKTPTPVVINANLPAAQVQRVIAPTPVIINANLPAAQVQRVIAPTPVIINANLPAIVVDLPLIKTPTPVIINANLPAIVVLVPRILLPTPVVINAILPAAAVNRQIRPAPVVINANLPAVQVQREIRPTPVVINANLPAIAVDTGGALVRTPTPVVINVVVPSISVEGVLIPTFLVQLLPGSTAVRFNDTNSIVVNAASAADARAAAKARFDGDSDQAWDDAAVTEIVAATDFTGWRLRVTILDTSPPLEVTVIGVAADTIDNLGLAMAVALNATAPIANALYTVGTNVLRVAEGSTDALGDRMMTVELLDPTLDVAIPGGVISVTDEGVPSADLSATLAADSFVPPLVGATARRTD